MFAKAFETTEVSSPSTRKSVPLAQNPSLQSYISKSKIPADSLINRQLQAVPLGGTRKDTWLQALNDGPRETSLSGTIPKYSDFQPFLWAQS
jgi:hypothetical protein